MNHIRYNKKTLYFALLLLMFCGVIGVGYFVYQNKLSSNPTFLQIHPSSPSISINPSAISSPLVIAFKPQSLSNQEKSTWKTYSNVAGYKLRYPSNLTPTAKAPGIGGVAAKATSDQVYIGAITITALPDPLPEYDYRNWTKEDVKISGLEATRYYKVVDSNSYKEFYFFSIEKTNRNVQITALIDSVEKAQLVNKLVTSFALTK
jgi:hypothetical protein